MREKEMTKMEICDFPIRHGGRVLVWPLAGGPPLLRAVREGDPPPRGYALALSSCPHTRRFSYTICAECADAEIRAALSE